MTEWYNQIPVASGLVDAFANKRAAVDLVRYREDTAVLVELKWASDTPAFAAFEILRYGLSFLFAFLHQSALGYQDKSLMAVQRTSLWVLAPRGFYGGYDLRSLAAGLSRGIGAVAAVRTDRRLSMNFSFRVFPNEFRLPFSSGVDVLRIAGEDTCGGREVASAIRGVSPLHF